MFKVFQVRALYCSRCILRRQKEHRSLSYTAPILATTSAEAVNSLFATRRAPGASHDDKIIRDIFDSHSFWKEFSQRRLLPSRDQTTGLFQNSYLSKPEGFLRFTDRTLQRAQRIVTKTLEASTVGDYKLIIKELDRLSDLVCRVIDLSDFVRATHPDPKYQEAATQAYGTMLQYMNVLNTTTGLNDQLKKAVSMPNVVASWTEEEKVVAQMLLRDFSKSAVDLDQASKQKFVALSDEVAHYGSNFVDKMAPEKPWIGLSHRQLKGMDPLQVRKLPTRNTNVLMPTMGLTALLGLRTIEDEDTRRELYMANRTASYEQLHRLKELLRSRAELARIGGFTSYAEMWLGDKMAKSPESVGNFLQALIQDNEPRLQKELSQLKQLKLYHAGFAGKMEETSKLNAWDVDFYRNMHLSHLPSKSRKPDFLSAYFSLGTVMQGLSRLFSCLYGIRFVPHETLPGETWNDDVRRIDVIDETEGHVAVLYCDLFERAGKNPNPAHFTVRCSRRISEAEIVEAASEASPFTCAEASANDGMAAARNSAGELYQLPTIALICDFTREMSNRPTLLSFRHVQTLFHEMGHAVHSILGRTALQNVAGTRCATDFAELPSVLMENFASDPYVLSLFARHIETDAPLPYEMVKDRMQSDESFEGIETESQILLAMVDQAYHSSLAPLEDDFDTSQIFHSILNRHGSIPEPWGTTWQGFFGHLYGYGATYYSYLFDRAIAGKVWRDVFQRTPEGAVSPEAGHLFKAEVLKWGGGRDPWQCIAGVLGDQSLANGDAKAMETVGRWGVGGS